MRLVLVPGPSAEVAEAVVSVSQGSLRSFRTVGPARPALLIEECIGVIDALHADRRWQEAMRRRGIEDLGRVQIDPWPAGTFGLDHEKERRISRCLMYVRPTRARVSGAGPASPLPTCG